MSSYIRKVRSWESKWSGVYWFLHDESLGYAFMVYLIVAALIIGIIYFGYFA